MLRESGCNDEGVILIGSTELPAQYALAGVSTDALRRIGVNVDLHLL